VLYDREAGSFLEPLWPEDTWWMDLHPYENLIAYNTSFEIGTANLEDGSIVSYFMLPDGSLYGTPYWSPDGEWLLFQGEIGAPSRSHVFKAHPDGSELTQLTSGEGDFTHPVWSPDGNSIAYLRSEQPGDSAELWVISADGDPQAVITDTHFVPWMYPVWSPDGSMLAAAGYGEGEYGTEGGLWVIPLDDGGTPWMVPGTEGLTAVNPVWYTDGWPMWDLWILPPGTELPEGEGWPLFFEARGEDGGGLWWYAPGLTESAAFYSSAAWGPIWCPEGENVLFGYTEGTEEERLTTIYSFPLISVP
jgi:dipeptidyl aminopeptidase/acylaminoacyl peptidase